MAMILQLDMASMKLISAMMKPAGKSLMAVSQSMCGTAKAGSPCGISPTTTPPICSKPASSLVKVSRTTVINTPGRRGACFLKVNNRVRAAAPNSSDAGCRVSRRSITCQISSMKCEVCVSGRPSRAGSCERPMMMAAALIKPINTGYERKLRMAPMRNRPKVSWNTPAIRASRMA